jgi:hypothetical protein
MKFILAAWIINLANTKRISAASESILAAVKSILAA